MAESKALYYKFFPLFSILAPKEKVKKYNQLINSASKGELNQAEAYMKAVELLDFNIHNTKSKL